MSKKPRELETTAVVTGGAQGIGHAICMALASQGYVVVSADMQHSASTKVEKVSREGIPVYEVGLDVRSSNAVEHTIALVERDVGPVGVLVNNAGVIDVGPILDVDEQTLLNIFDVNTFGTFRCTQIVGRVMKARSSGRIINIASIAGKGGRPVFAAYAASKAAVINLTQSFALALAPYGIAVNAVCPGIVPTAMWDRLDEALGELEKLKPGAALARRVAAIPLGREETPKDVADLVAFLTSDAAGYITGQSINVDGGLEFN